MNDFHWITDCSNAIQTTATLSKAWKGVIFRKYCQLVDQRLSWNNVCQHLLSNHQTWLLSVVDHSPAVVISQRIFRSDVEFTLRLWSSLDQRFFCLLLTIKITSSGSLRCSNVNTNNSHCEKHSIVELSCFFEGSEI